MTTGQNRDLASDSGLLHAVGQKAVHVGKVIRYPRKLHDAKVRWPPGAESPLVGPAGGYAYDGHAEMSYRHFRRAYGLRTALAGRPLWHRWFERSV